jgi:hypothetical protein
METFDLIRIKLFANFVTHFTNRNIKISIMRKLIFTSSLLLTFLLILIVPIFSQAVHEDPNVWESVTQFRFFIGSFPGTAFLLFFLIPSILGIANVKGKEYKYLISTGVILLISIFAKLIPIGFLYGLKWWAALVAYAMFVLIHIGLFAWPYTKEIQDKIYDKWNRKAKT